jgi:hypothetical protein
MRRFRVQTLYAHHGGSAKDEYPTIPLHRKGSADLADVSVLAKIDAKVSNRVFLTWSDKLYGICTPENSAQISSSLSCAFSSSVAMWGVPSRLLGWK